jgi:hypothetical protein
MPKLAPPPPVAPETWRALLDDASAFAAAKPWKYMYDSDVVGLIDPITGETRIGTVLGNAGEVFAAVFYRRPDGLRWIFGMLDIASADLENFNIADGMDVLKLEFVPKRELWKEDLAALKTAAFQPAGKGSVWPQFRSAEPGWHPWHISQSEAEQFLADLPRLTAFCKLFEENPALFDGRGQMDIPFLPATLPNRPLTPDDLDWRPLLSPPAAGCEPFQISTDHLGQLRALKRQPGLACEFDCLLIPGGSFIESGRPCFGRFGLLVEKRRGLVIGMSMQSGGCTPGDAAGRGLVESLLKAGHLPEKIFISGPRLQPALQPLCDELQIELQPSSSLPVLEEAIYSMSQHMMGAM